MKHITLINNGNTNNSINKIENKNNVSEEIKLKIISVLLWKNLLDFKESKNIITISDVKKYMNELYHNKKINLDEYIQIWVEAGAMKIWNYLILKWYITKEILNEALKIQKNDKDWRTLWSILLEEKSLYNSVEEELTFEKLSEALNVLWIRKLWEYLAHLGIIKYDQISYYLEQQRLKWKPIWKLLVEEWIISQIKLNEILKDLWVKIKLEDLSLDLDGNSGEFETISSDDIWWVNYLK